MFVPLKSTPRLLFLPASFGIFAIGMLAASIFLFRGKTFQPSDMVLSTLESSFANPHGFRFASTAIVLSALLLVPVVLLWFQTLRADKPLTASVAAASCLLSVAAAVAIGFAPPREDLFSPLHIQLAFATFGFLCAGTLFFLFAADAPILLRLWQGGGLLFTLLVYLLPGTALAVLAMQHVALLEWIFCANCAGGTWMLAWHIEKHGNRWK